MKFFIYLQKEKMQKKTEKQKYKFLLGNYIPTASLRVQQTSHKCTCERKCIRTHTYLYVVIRIL